MATFHLGLTMAGAISAGAYTAGVFDFLIEALDEWEKAKANARASGTPEADWQIPCHDVVIPVMSGASAGGITGALGLVALAEKPPEEEPFRRYPYPQVGTVESRLPRLYRAWVEMPRFVDRDGGPALLGTDDLGDGPVASLLDATILDRIVDRSLSGIREVGSPRPFLTDGVDLFLTHSNLIGVPYEIDFSGSQPDQPGYPMMAHGDRRHFRVTGIGTARFTSDWAKDDPAVAMDVSTLAGAAGVSELWRSFSTAAVGSGAFPIGLPARIISPVLGRDYIDRQWPIDFPAHIAGGKHGFRLAPAKRFGRTADQESDFVASDGGIINNEPFELAHWTLAPRERDAAGWQVERCDQAVIMIDPFPEPPAYDPRAVLDASLAGVLGRLIPTLINQARFKPTDLADALDESVHSRFLIAPRRRRAAESDIEDCAISCGLLGGFGGFLSEEFRAHDYQLGRFNCFHFLKNTLALRTDNDVLKSGYLSDACRNAFKARSPAHDKDGHYCQVIPLVGTAAEPPRPPIWPRVSRDEVEEMVGHAGTRADAVVPKLIDETATSPAIRTGARLFWSSFGRSRLATRVRWTLTRELLLRDQIDWLVAGADVAERKVMAALADPAYDFRTVGAIARRFHLEAERVDAVLAKHADVIAEGERTADGRRTYTLKERRPGGFSQWPVVRQLDRWLLSGPPSVD